MQYDRGMLQIIIKIKVRKVRKRKGITIAQLSNISGISESYISELEREKKIPTLYVICALAAALDVNETELYEKEIIHIKKSL